MVVKEDQTKTVHRTLRNKVNKDKDNKDKDNRVNKDRNHKGQTWVTSSLDKASLVRVARETRVVSQVSKVEEVTSRVHNPAGLIPIVQAPTETGIRRFPALRIMNQIWIRI